MNIIRPFLRTLSYFPSRLPRRHLVDLNKNHYTNLFLCLNFEGNSRWRYLSANSSQAKDGKDLVEETDAHDIDSGEKVKIFFKNHHGKLFEVEAKVGENVLQAAQDGGLDMAGACGAQLTCTTCHVYIDEESEEIIPEPTQQEDDLLDKAPFLKENSRLSCQIIVTKELEGRVFSLPIATRNFNVDGHVFPTH